jgi:NADPH:quinone reductase-like Zn-dependent oxidoreductase
VVVDHTYPLEQAVDALEQVEHGHVRGKVVRIA